MRERHGYVEIAPALHAEVFVLNAVIPDLRSARRELLRLLALTSGRIT